MDNDTDSATGLIIRKRQRDRVRHDRKNPPQCNSRHLQRMFLSPCFKVHLPDDVTIWLSPQLYLRQFAFKTKNPGPSTSFLIHCLSLSFLSASYLLKSCLIMASFPGIQLLLNAVMKETIGILNYLHSRCPMKKLNSNLFLCDKIISWV